MKNFAARYSLSCICFSISVIYFHAYEVLITELKQHYNSMLPTPRTITCDKSLRASHKFFVVYLHQLHQVKSQRTQQPSGNGSPAAPQQPPRLCRVVWQGHITQWSIHGTKLRTKANHRYITGSEARKSVEESAGKLSVSDKFFCCALKLH